MQRDKPPKRGHKQGKKRSQPKPAPSKPVPSKPETLPAPVWWPGAVEALTQAWLHTRGFADVQGVERNLTDEPIDGVVRQVLAQQNTRAVAQRQFAALRSAYPFWEAALLAEPDELEAVLKEAGGGLSRSKSRRVHAMLRQVRERRGTVSLHYLHGLGDAEARAELEALPGVGRRTASLLLLFHLGRPAAAADKNMERVLRRLEVVPPTWDAAKCERWLEHTLPAEWHARAAFHRAGSWLGREICRPDPRCGRCPLQRWCPTGQLGEVAR